MSAPGARLDSEDLSKGLELCIQNEKQEGPSDLCWGGQGGAGQAYMGRLPLLKRPKHGLGLPKNRGLRDRMSSLEMEVRKGAGPPVAGTCPQHWAERMMCLSQPGQGAAVYRLLGSGSRL